MLQYADDTLILVKAEVSLVHRLKNVLAAATGLKINFHKSTVVPMHVEATFLQQCLAVMGCREEQFPQSYLGLLLSHEKLRINTFVPMTSKAYKYLGSRKLTHLCYGCSGTAKRHLKGPGRETQNLCLGNNREGKRCTMLSGVGTSLSSYQKKMGAFICVESVHVT